MTFINRKSSVKHLAYSVFSLTCYHSIKNNNLDYAVYKTNNTKRDTN